MLTKRTKTKIIGETRRHDKDTGSPEVQIAIISRQMDELAEHLKKNPKDNHSRRGLLKMVSERRKLIAYLKKREPAKFDKLGTKLEVGK